MQLTTEEHQLANQNRDDDQELHPAFLLGISILILGAIFAALAYYWYRHVLVTYPDQAIYLAMADLFLDGYKPYVDMFDMNPPLILYVNVLPVLIARALNIPSIFAFSYFVNTLTFISVAFSGALMFKHRRSSDSFFFIPLLAAFLLLCQAQIIDFGQREHLLIITYLPFFMVRYFRWNNLEVNKYAALFAGLFAAPCLCFKPHFIVMAAAPELVFFLKTYNWRKLIAPETIVCIIFGIIYVLHFLFLDKQVSETFWHTVVPLVKNGYGYYTVSPLKLMADFGRIEFHIIAIVLILAIPLSPYCKLIAPIAAYMVASLAIYLVAGQDWSHHMIPILFGTYALRAIYIAIVVRYFCKYSEHARLLNTYMISIIAVLISLQFAVREITTIEKEVDESQQFSLLPTGYQGWTPLGDVAPWADIVLKYSKANDPILFISNAIAPGYPATLHTGRRPASRYIHGLPLMMLNYIAFERQDLKDRQVFEDRFYKMIQQYGADIQRTKPSLIVIRNAFMKGVLERGGFFGEYMDNYELVETFDDHLIYRRKQGAQ